MRWIVVALAVAIVAHAGEAKSQALDGNSLFSACTSIESAQQGFCIGFVVGAIEGMRYGLAFPLMADGNRSATEINEMSNSLLMNCPPVEVNNGQYTDIVVNFLRNHPEIRHGSARIMIHSALRDAFPCD